MASAYMHPMPAAYTPFPTMVNPYGAAKLYFLTNKDQPLHDDLEAVVDPLARIMTRAPRLRESTLESSVGHVYDIARRAVNRYSIFPAENEDFVQDVVSAMVARAGQFRQTTQDYRKAFDGAVFHAGRNRVISEVRHKKILKMGGLTEGIAQESALRALDEIPDRMYWEGRLQLYVALLPEAQQEVAALRFFNHMTIRMVAEATGKTENNVKVCMHKAGNALRQIHDLLKTYDTRTMSAQTAQRITGRKVRWNA